MPEFTRSTTIRVWRLTFDASFDDKRIGGDREIVIYTLDQSGAHPYPHQIDFTDEDEAAKAHDVASYGETVIGSVANIRVTTWQQRVETTEPVDVDLAVFGRRARRGRRGTGPEMEADDER
jgi:hypothetical protein